MKLRSAWLLTLPILLLAETAGHAVAVRLFDPDDARHRALLNAVAVAAALSALSLAALAWRVATTSRSRSHPLPSWRLAAVPALAFLAQEHVESFVADGRAAWLTAAEPAVIAGVGLQLAVGAAALWLARSLLRAADHLGWALSRSAARATGTRSRAGAWPLEAVRARGPVLASRHAGRAPPAAA